MHMQQRSKVYFLLALGVLAMLLPATAKAATTIGNNVSVGGTLGAGGLSTLTGGFISSASSTISSGGLHVTGALNASSTFQVAGATVLSGTVTLGSTMSVGGLTTLTGGFISSASSTISSGGLHVTGALNASSTFQVAGATVLAGTVTLSSTLSSSLIPTTADTYNLGSFTASFASLFASSTVFSASSTVFNANSTSSVYIKSGIANRGGQLILKAYNGTCYAVYIGLFNDGALGVTSTALATCY